MTGKFYLMLHLFKGGITPQPGKPQQNAYIERYNRTARYGLLNQYLFKNLEDIQDSATRWLWFYNHERPHQANGGKPPLMGFDSTETCH